MAAKLSNIQVGAAKTPSQAIIDDANLIVYETDKRGRQIGVRRITSSIRRRVIKALSAESGEKPRYFQMCVLAAAVVSIDGEDVRMPTTEMQFDALIDRLDDDGEVAVAKAYRQFVDPDDETPEEQAKN